MHNQISNPTKTALIVGANGVIGTNLINHLVSLGNWNIIGLSRRGGISSTNLTYIPVNLLDKEDTAKQLSALSAVTHIFYAAYQDKPTWAELVEPNLTMLVNVVDVIEPGAANASDAEGAFTAPMPGKVLDVLVPEGAKVREGQDLMVLEAMKMEHRIAADRDGTVASIYFQTGDQVDAGSVLLDFVEDE